MSAAAQVRRATGKMCAQVFRRAARFQIAIAKGKPDYAIGIRNVQKLGIVTRRIKRDPEWFLQTLFCENFGHVRLSVAFGVTQHLDSLGATLHDEDVAIGRGEQKSRITKPARIPFDRKTRRHTKLCACWPL